MSDKMTRELQPPELQDLSVPDSDSSLAHEVQGFKGGKRFAKAAGVATAGILIGGAVVRAASPDISGQKISKELAGEKEKAASQPAVASLEEMTKVNIPGVETLSQPTVTPSEETATAESNQVPLHNFENSQDAVDFLDGEKGAEWLSGEFAALVSTFPESSSQVWGIFSNLQTVGNEPHYVILMPNASGDKVTAIGVETIKGNTYLDYIDFEGNPAVVKVNGTPDFKTLQGKSYNEWFFTKAAMVWPNINFPAGNCELQKRNPVEGVTEGRTCSSDGTRGFWYQHQTPKP